MSALDDLNQTVFYIPFAGEDHPEIQHPIPLPQSLYAERDLPEGHYLRVKAYEEAWRKCLDRVMSIIRDLNVPIVGEIVQFVQTSYDDILPGLPYPELPVICITDPNSGSTFMHDVTSQLDLPDLSDSTLFDVPCFTTHLYPTDCSTITSTLRTMIAGFIDRPHILEKVKGRPAISLANYDIEMLSVWYAAVRGAYSIEEKSQPKLVIVLHDFEQLDPAVIQDLLSISSLYVSRLPLVFILALSSPSPSSYLHMTYPRSTLSLLRVRTFTVPSGPDVLEKILLQTFFDIEFEPDIMIGPEMLIYLTEAFTRQHSSLDATLTTLHLAHLKHFSVEPLTVLVQYTPSSDVLEQPSSAPFLESLWARLRIRTQSSHSPNAVDLSNQTTSALIAHIDAARTNFRFRAARLRIGFRIINLVQEFMRHQGYKGLRWEEEEKGVTIFNIMIDVLRDSVIPDIRALGGMIKKLRVSQLGALLEKLSLYLDCMPSTVLSNEEEARTKLAPLIKALPERHEDKVSEAGAQLASSVADWLVEYLKSILAPLENASLWEVWYTGQAQFPSDLMNPSMRASIVSGLLYPHEFAELTEDDHDDSQVGFSLWEYPDTSILFRRYLDSGKMINLYDWFESFHLVLETQRRGLKKRKHASESRSRPPSPIKRSGKGKGKVIEKAEEEEEIDEDAWKIQIQARFMRALHELDYLGFIKHTGRKADHVLRTVFDMYD